MANFFLSRRLLVSLDPDQFLPCGFRAAGQSPKKETALESISKAAGRQRKKEKKSGLFRRSRGELLSYQKPGCDPIERRGAGAFGLQPSLRIGRLGIDHLAELLADP
jgi:hypothetical protein